MNGQSPEYSPFHPDLDQQYPVGSIKIDRDSVSRVVNGEIEPLAWASFFRNSPANNFEAEALMGAMLTAALRAGQWVDVLAPTADQITEPVSFTGASGTLTIDSIRYEYPRGVEILCRLGFASRVADETGRNYLRPAKELMKYFNNRVGFRAANPEA